jgi:hypothetical protein
MPAGSSRRRVASARSLLPVMGDLDSKAYPKKVNGGSLKWSNFDSSVHIPKPQHESVHLGYTPKLLQGNIHLKIKQLYILSTTYSCILSFRSHAFTGTTIPPDPSIFTAEHSIAAP